MLKEFLESDLKKVQNLKKIYSLIHEHQPITQVELIEMTKLNQTTLFRMIERLQNDKLIEECGYGESNGGRPPVLYRVNANLGYIVSVRINRMFTQVSLHDLKYTFLDNIKFTMTKEHTPRVVLEEVIEIIHRFMTEHQITNEQLLGIGISVVGPLDIERGIILDPEPFIAPGWSNVPIVDELKRHFPVKILLENGGTLAALGEYKGDYSHYKNILCSISSWGIGFGVISNGEFVRAHNGNGGLFGHIVINTEGRMCTCGKRGCLIAYTSLFAVLKELESTALFGKWSLNWARENTLPFVEQLNQHREETYDIMMRSAYYYGVGLSNIINLLETEVAILSGPAISIYDGYFEKVKETVLKNITLNRNVKIVQEKSLQEFTSVGAAAFVFSSYFEQT